MSLIKMSYIIIEKENGDKALDEVMLSYLKQAGFEYTEDGFHVGSDIIKCSINHRKNSNRWYLELSSSMRVNRGIDAIQKLDNSILKSDFGKYAQTLRAFDGISESICESLYKKCSTFERRIRQLILLVLTKAFGCDWRNETISQEMLKTLKSNAKGQLSLTDTLEQFDLCSLEKYLFETDESSLKLILSEQLSKDCLKEMSKEDICGLIEEMRPQSLWDKFFVKFGSSEEWEKRIEEIREVRNKVSHHKHISLEEKNAFIPKINRVNRDLLSAIDEITQRDFTNENAIVSLGRFADLCIELGQAMAARFDYSKLLTEINDSLKRITEPLADLYLNLYSNNIEKMIQNMLGITSISNNISNIYTDKKIEKVQNKIDNKEKDDEPDLIDINI